METIFMSKENRKTNEPHKFILDSSQKIKLKKFK